jgi:hypothetical protein
MNEDQVLTIKDIATILKLSGRVEEAPVDTARWSLGTIAANVGRKVAM